MQYYELKSIVNEDFFVIPYPFLLQDPSKYNSTLHLIIMSP